MAAFLIYLIIFFVPLLVLPEVSLRFEPPKVLLSEFLIEVLVIFSFLGSKFSFKRVNKVLLVFVAAFFLLSLIHLVLSPTSQNLFGNIFRLQGTILFWHFLFLTLIAQNIYFKLTQKYIYITSFIGVCAGAFIFGNNSAGRWIGTLGEPNALAAVTIFIFPFVFLNFKSVWVRAVGVVGAVGVINFTESKSALIGFALELLFLGLIKLFKGKYLPASLICISLLILSLGLPIAERIHFLNTNTDPLNFRFEDRAQIWQIALISGFDSPVYGSGLESIQDQIHRTAAELKFDSQYQVIDSSHNLFLDYWIWGGLVGLGLLGVLVILGFKNMIKKKMMLELTVFLGLLTALSFNPTTVTVLAAFWWILGRSFAKLEVE